MAGVLHRTDAEMLRHPAPDRREPAIEPDLMRERLRAVLAARPGERILEIGAGRGDYALSIAGDLRPGGTIDILDAQPQMLTDAMRAARERSVRNLTARLGDARHLPYDDGRFDAVYLVAAIGGLPDAEAALREVARVLRSRGRLVVGELHGDPHRVDPATLRDVGVAAGFLVTRQIEVATGYLAVLRRPRR